MFGTRLWQSEPDTALWASKVQCNNKFQCKSSGRKAMNFITIFYGFYSVISSRNVDSSGHQCQQLTGSPLCGCLQEVSTKEL